MHEENLRELFVYECSGPQSPTSEPDGEGFLGVWPEPPYYYLFFESEAAHLVLPWVEGQSGWVLKRMYRLNYDEWQQALVGEYRVGPFVIRSSGSHTHSKDLVEGIKIELNPGVVFGSGLHASTRGCLLAVADLFQKTRIAHVVDLGTGTGILALACVLLGASRVFALDCNPLAVRVARKNIASNGMEGVVQLLVAQDLTVLREPSDLLIMNIEWPCLQRVVRGDDWMRYPRVVLSGFLGSQWENLKTLIPPAFGVVYRKEIEGWTTVVAVRNPVT